MNYAYIRVSTESQTVENQRIVISDYAKKSGVRKLEWVAETISGTKAPDDRKLGELLKKVQEGDAIICTEISRLGRSMVMIMTILDYCLKRKVKVMAIKENFVLDNSIGCKALMFALGLSAEIERAMISERTKAGLERARIRGKKIGRVVGEKPTMFKLTPYKKEIQKGLKEGRTINSLARQFKVRWPTMKSFVTVNMFIKPKRRSVKREGEKELTSGKLRYKLKEWIFKKF